jgi:radical SAM superfamily enzyme YgiQ (UPF0313 family)
MRTALIVPRNTIISSDKFEDSQWEETWEFKSRKRLWSCPSLSLLTVAGMLPQSFSIDYIDLNYDTEINGDYELALFSPSTSQANQAYLLADGLRKKGTKVVMGGPHVSVLPEEALQHSDSVFIGESEETFPIFLKDLKKGALKKVYAAETYPDLALSPSPRYDLLGAYDYKSVPIQLSRGCPHQCEFCISSQLYGKKYRRKSIQQVYKEIEAILSVRPKPFIFFTDDNMFLDKEYSLRILDLLRSLNVRWYAFTDAHIADDRKFLEVIAKSGCSRLLIGFESLTAENLIQINPSLWKMKRCQDYKKIIETIQSYGIGVVGSFVIGLDDDKEDVFDKIEEFVLETNLYATNITILTPFPGTRLYKRYKEINRLFDTDWSRYNGFELTFDFNNMKKEDFEKKFFKLYQNLNSKERITNVLNYFKNVLNEKNKIKGST